MIGGVRQGRRRPVDHLSLRFHESAQLVKKASTKDVLGISRLGDAYVKWYVPSSITTAAHGEAPGNSTAVER